MLVVVGSLGAGPVLAQEDLNRGKSAAQLFASDCADCHRNPRAVGNRDNANVLADFLRVHYTASRESAAAIAAYLVALGPDSRTGSARPAAPARSRPAAAQEQGKASPESQPAAKPAEPTPPTPPEPVPQAPAAPAGEPQ
jgi:hypothetical protein